jgi:hypothetical protein
MKQTKSIKPESKHTTDIEEIATTKPILSS